MKKITLTSLDSKGFVIDEYSVNIVNNTQMAILTIDDHDYYIRENGELTLVKNKDVFVVSYQYTIMGDKDVILLYALRASNDKEALRQAMLNTEFLTELNSINFDKKHISVYKPSYYKNDDLNKLMRFELKNK